VIAKIKKGILLLRFILCLIRISPGNTSWWGIGWIIQRIFKHLPLFLLKLRKWKFISGTPEVHLVFRFLAEFSIEPAITGEVTGFFSK